MNTQGKEKIRRTTQKLPFQAEEVAADTSGPTIRGATTKTTLSLPKRKIEEEEETAVLEIDDSPEEPHRPGAMRVAGFGGTIASNDNDTIVVGGGDDGSRRPQTAPSVTAQAELMNDPVVAAEVGDDPTRQDFEELQRQLDSVTKQNRRQLCMIITVVVLAVVGVGGAAVAVVFLIGNNDQPNPAPTPDNPDEIVSSPAPTGSGPVMPPSSAEVPATTTTQPPSSRPSLFPTMFPTLLPTVKPTPEPEEPTDAPTSVQPTSIRTFEYQRKWFANISPAQGGNKILHVQSGDIVLATDRDGGIWCLEPNFGEVIWTYDASDLGIERAFSDGGASVGEKAGIPFMVYPISSGIRFGSDATCTIVGRSFDGVVMFQSEAPASGQCVGTPKISGDGQHVFFSHSLHPETLRNGCFSVLNTADGSIYYSFCADLAQPMSEPGCFNNPATGNYIGGETNTNDICVVGLAPYDGETGVGTSATYAFQKPSDPVLQPTHTQLLGADVERGIEWQLNAPPLIFDQGYGMLISGSRNKIHGWFGVPVIQDADKNRENMFDRLPPQRPDSIRGTPLWLASFSTPVIGFSGEFFVSGARTEIRAWLNPELNSDNGGIESWIYQYTSASAPFTGVVLAPDNSRVYFQEGQSGSFYALDAATGSVVWADERPTVGTAILADFSVDEFGSTMYMVDEAGQVVALKLADVSFGP